jgi:hypothetical protein
MMFIHICEVCGKEEILESEVAYNQGWDYPPKIGVFGVVSPRTCGSCSINHTLWWELTVNKTPIEKLSQRHKDTLHRILSEPEIVLPGTKGEVQ